MFAFFLRFASLTPTAYHEQLKKIEIASFVKLKIQQSNADTLGW